MMLITYCLYIYCLYIYCLLAIAYYTVPIAIAYFVRNSVLPVPYRHQIQHPLPMVDNCGRRDNITNGLVWPKVDPLYSMIRRPLPELERASLQLPSPITSQYLPIPPNPDKHPSTQASKHP